MLSFLASPLASPWLMCIGCETARSFCFNGFCLVVALKIAVFTRKLMKGKERPVLKVWSKS